ncbi:glycosyltransferase [Candidatus Microgenomates bacterium]|nr:glycosyltransferase [Candidatus Microgenomates bacterium]
MKVALVYDRVNKWGGAESVLLALHDLWPEAPLYTSVYDKEATPWADVFDVRTSFLQKLPLPKTAHEYYPYLMGIAFESFDFDAYDLVISVTHEFAKAIITKPKTYHLCYCLNPVGYLWSGFHDYFLGKSDFFKAITAPLISYLRWYDGIVAQRPDQYLAISKTVQARIKKYYCRNSDVIYPPVNLSMEKTQKGGDKFFLIVSRLAAEKRLDLAIAAFNKLGWPLKIIGVGREGDRLKKKAKGNIKFLGHLTDGERNRYYKSCQAVIIPGVEDFNLVAVEAQSFGKPVVALNAGGVT